MRLPSRPPRFARHGLFLLVMAVVAVAIFSEDDASPESSSREILAARILPEVAASDDPWALAHGLLALEPGSDLLDRWLATIEGHLIEADDHWRLPLTGVDGDRGEQHPHLVLRTLALLAGEGRATAASSALLARLLPAARHGGGDDGDWRAINDLAWKLEALSDLAAGDRAAAAALEPLAHRLLAALVDGDRLVDDFLVAGLEGKRPDSGTPQTSGTWAYTCGGQHLISALIAAADAGAISGDAREQLSVHVDLYARRLLSELAYRLREEQAAVDAGVSPVRASRRGILERLKLTGHGLEILARARFAGIGEDAFLAETGATVEAFLKVDMVFLDSEVDPDVTLLGKLRDTDPGAWERWVGDGCHALHGLRRWRAQ